MARKFRPSLTVTQLEYIHSFCKAQSDTNPIASQIALILSEYVFKIKLGALKHEYKVETVEEKLGIEKGENEREAAYNKYLSFPQLCTPKEELDAHTFMYENDLMNAEQEAAFEAKHLGV